MFFYYLHLINVKKNKEFEDLIETAKYNKFKQNLQKPDSFKNEDDAIDYYYKQLDLLLKICKKDLDSLMTEKQKALYPSEESEIACLILKYIEEIQGI